MKEELQRIKADALDAIKGLTDIQSLQDIRVKYLGKKGEVTALLKGLGKLSPEERPKAGALVNAVREALEAEIDTVKVRMETAELNARLEQERIDITLPGRAQKAGHIHPLTKVNEMIEDFFMKMGYTVEEGPEIEQDYFNFECLNLPKTILHVICKIPSILQKTSYCVRIHLQYKLVQCNVMSLTAQSV